MKAMFAEVGSGAAGWRCHAVIREARNVAAVALPVKQQTYAL